MVCYLLQINLFFFEESVFLFSCMYYSVLFKFIISQIKHCHNAWKAIALVMCSQKQEGTTQNNNKNNSNTIMTWIYLRLNIGTLSDFWLGN